MKKLISMIMVVITIFTIFTVAAYAADIFTCPVCGKKYYSHTEYNECIESHKEEEKDKLYTCEVCGKKFTTLEEYNNCLDEHRNGTKHNYEHYIGVTLPELAQKIVSSMNSSGIPDILKELISKVLDYLSDFIYSASAEV